jgi:hypothetical protein
VNWKGLESGTPGEKKKRGRKRLEAGKLKKKNTYILTYTYGGTYKYVRWGGGLEFSKL